MALPAAEFSFGGDISDDDSGKAEAPTLGWNNPTWRTNILHQTRYLFRSIALVGFRSCRLCGVSESENFTAKIFV